MKNQPPLKAGAIVVAAGSSMRMRGINKIFVELAGRPVLGHVLSAFESCDSISRVVVVMNEASMEKGRALIAESGFSKSMEVCRGGRRRQDSVAEGLKRLRGCHWVIIHDGARPCVTRDLIERGLNEARVTHAAIAAVPLKDTVKSVDPDGWIINTPSREGLWAAQTPQVFRKALLAKAYRNISVDVTDDASLVETAGGRVKVYMGSYENIKITTPEDLPVAETILRRRHESRHRV